MGVGCTAFEPALCALGLWQCVVDALGKQVARVGDVCCHWWRLYQKVLCSIDLSLISKSKVAFGMFESVKVLELQVCVGHGG